LVRREVYAEDHYTDGSRTQGGRTVFTGGEGGRGIADLRLRADRVGSQAGSGLDKIVKTTVFLHTMDDFGVMNEVYNRYFSKDPPARSTIEVARLPKGMKIEIEAIALV
jgi:2-iminobutanoate/2-iminopropanoate deaminase